MEAKLPLQPISDAHAHVHPEMEICNPLAIFTTSRHCS